MLEPFARAFTRPGFPRFVEWLTGLALNVEEHTKNELLAALRRRQAHCTPGPQLGVFDGADAVGNVVRPLLRPEAGEPRIDFLTRLRHDARPHEERARLKVSLWHPLDAPSTPKAAG